MAAANQDLIKAINQFDILNTIRMAGAISRTEIAQITGQSRSTITNITARLIKENQIIKQKTENSNTRGRRRVLLALNPDAAYVVGVKLSALRISCAVTDMQAEIKSSVNIPVRISERPVDFLVDLIEDGVRHCVTEARLHLDKISGIGIGFPGFVDSRSGICYWTPLFQKSEISLKDLIQDRFEIRTYVENDANTVTLAQQWFGEGKGVDNFLVVTIEDGIGMGIVVNGQLYRGARGFAAELGHMIVDPDGSQCLCGKKGCISAYSNIYSILDAARRAYANGEWERNNDAELTFEEITTAAQNGQPALCQILARAGHFLGTGMASLIQILNPTRIILSGEGVRAGKLMLSSMHKAIRANTNKELLGATEIVIQKWCDADWARGAASLVLQELYKAPFNRLNRMI